MGACANSPTLYMSHPRVAPQIHAHNCDPYLQPEANLQARRRQHSVVRRLGCLALLDGHVGNHGVVTAGQRGWEGGVGERSAGGGGRGTTTVDWEEWGRREGYVKLPITSAPVAGRRSLLGMYDLRLVV